MRRLLIGMTLPFFAAILLAAEKTPRLRFTRDDIGKLPAGWKAERTGEGEGSVWEVVANASAPSKNGFALAQTARGPRALFNLCVAEDGRYRDGEAQVAFKAVAGDIDQGGGLVWRFQDARNYYLARMNPLESNYRVYKVVAGKRIQLGTKEDVKVPAGRWPAQVREWLGLPSDVILAGAVWVARAVSAEGSERADRLCEEQHDEAVGLLRYPVLSRIPRLRRLRMVWMA